MSSFGGFGGFGQNNNQNQQQQNTGFGGFGSNNQSTGFGSSGGFGSTNTGGGLFGNTSSGFGTGGSGGFGQQSSTTGFGAPKPAFGAATSSSGGGLFGSNTLSAPNAQSSGGFGGFGSTTANNTSGGFGASSTGGLFGQNKPAFGNTAGTGASLFGGGGGSTGGFGSGTQAQTAGFGSSQTGGFGASAPAQNNGTSAVQFEPHREKEGSATSVFHSITMQEPYQQYSFEELRLADYQQGKRFGNANGQAGAFGQSTPFGGFGSNNAQTGGFGSNNTSGGLFGSSSQQSTTSGFGQQQQQQQASTGFGSGGGGLFGSKPTTGGGLFGSTPASTAQTSGGLFGTSGGGGGFGSGTSGFGGGSSGTGLFGNQQSQDPKPFGGFGTSTSTGFGQSSGTTGFGQTATSSSGGGLFGSGGTTSFGQNTGTSFGGFGNNQQTQNQSGGGLFGGSFGSANQQQNKPGGLFGSTQPSTGSNLFGGQTQQQSGGLFGNANASQQQSGGLFGNKPATTGNSLFGGSTINTNTGGGLFGNLGQQNQANTGGALFGANTQPQKTSLFGNLNTNTNTTSNTGGGLFGNLGQTNNNSNNNNNNQGSSLFGNSQQTQQPQSNSLFGSLNQSQQQAQQAPQLTASLIGANPYGNDQLFASLGTSTPSPGPIATPLSGSSKARKPAVLPHHKINPLAASRLITPQKRPSGFGFSYSTYGTPGSAIGTPTGMNGLLASGSLGKSLGKSFSASNLRNVYNAESSNLVPGLFSPGRSPYTSNNMKRLSINRNLDTRRTLFADDEDVTPRKRVLFDESTPSRDPTANGALNGNTGALVRTEEDSPGSTIAGSPEAHSQLNGAFQTNGTLVTVPEEEQAAPTPTANKSDAVREHARRMQTDQDLGVYWSRPPLKELQNKSRGVLKRIHLVVGREGCGEIDFGEVDLSDTPLDKLFNTIVNFDMRRATVYGGNAGMQKPAPGKALNVPSTITLENSWPRKHAGKEPVYQKSGPQLDKHVSRLKRVPGTDFVAYNPMTGAWTFRVQHYTTYGLDYDDDDDASVMSGAIPTEQHAELGPTNNVFAAADMTPIDDQADGFESSPEDTFHFRQGKTIKRVPGTFDEDEGVEYEDDEEMEEAHDSFGSTQQSFLDDGSVGRLIVRDGDDIDGYAPEEQEEMAGSYPVQPTEPDPVEDSPVRLKSILKTSQFGPGKSDTPSKNRLVFESNWTEQLRRTASPRKQNRQALRESQSAIVKPAGEAALHPKTFGVAKGFTTSIDIMNSLFGRNERPLGAAKKQSVGGKGFEWPYEKHVKTKDAFAEMSEEDRAFHLSNKPSWGPDGRLVFATHSGASRLPQGILANVNDRISGEPVDICFAKLAVPSNLLPATVDIQRSCSKVTAGADAIPAVSVSGDVPFEHFAASVDTSNAAGRQEKAVWELTSILFDDLSRDEMVELMTPEERPAYISRLRKDKLSTFWKDLVKRDAETAAFTAKSGEEKAMQYISAGNLPSACSELMSTGDFKLATLFAQAPGSDAKFRDYMRRQIMHWDELNDLSEMSTTTRAFYEILAGNTGEVVGKGGPRENRYEAFGISEHFGFDWRRAFGLRLWFGILPDSGIEDAVLAYYTALAEEKENVLPLPPYVQEPAEDESREDLLWGLLQLYASQQSADIAAHLESILATENITANPLDARLSWQLMLLLRAKGIKGSAGQGDDDEEDQDSEKENRRAVNRSKICQPYKVFDDATDRLTSIYGSALTSSIATATPEQQPHLLFGALGAFLHLSGAQARRAAIDDLLSQTAPLLASEAEPSLTLPGAALTNNGAASKPTTLHAAINGQEGLRIPREWSASAQALWARAVERNPTAEARHLLEAGQINAAHAVLLHDIGPACVVRRNYDTLREALGGFEGGRAVTGWKAGGGVYFDFVHLLDMDAVVPRSRGGDDAAAAAAQAKERRDTMARLVDGLVAMGKDAGRDVSVTERAGLWEMSRVVAEKADREKVGVAIPEEPQLVALTLKQGSEKAKVLSLPLTEDTCLKHTRELSLLYYRALMAGGR